MRTPGRPANALLSRDVIVAAALELIEQRGYARFSVHELAQRLGVSPRAVRHHVGSRDQLLRAAADAVVSGIELPSPDTLDWDDWLRLVATSVRGRLVDRPALIPLVLEQWPGTRRGAQLVAATLDVLLEASGGDVALAVTTHNVFWAFVAGTVYSQGSRSPAVEAVGAIDEIGGRADVAASLDRLRATYGAAYPGADAVDVAFTAALDVTLAGLHTALGRQGSGVRTARP